MSSIRVRYWDYPEAGTIELWGRTCDDQEFKLLKEIVPARETAQWIDYVYDLPADYNRKNWIQINIRGTLEGNAEVLLDTYSILQNLERDFSVLEVSTPPNTPAGERCWATASRSPSSQRLQARSSRATLMYSLLTWI